MVFVHYVYSFLLPFHQPAMLDGGRTWLLELLIDNKALFHAAISLSSYFWTLSLKNSVVGSKPENMGALSQQGLLVTLKSRVRVMESIVQLMVTRTSNWDIHLSAAITRFKEVFQYHGMVNVCPDVRKVMLAMDTQPSKASFSGRRKSNTD